MQQLSSIWVRRSLAEDLAADGWTNHGVAASCRDGLGLAMVEVRKGCQAELAQRLRDRFQIDLPDGPCRSIHGVLAFHGIGPRTWLATEDEGTNALAASLHEIIGKLAAISDQTDAFSVLRVSGCRARDVLSKLVPVDLHPRSCAVGAVAVTAASMHIPVTLWRCGDDAAGSPVFDIAVPRSFTLSFWDELMEAAVSGQQLPV